MPDAGFTRRTFLDIAARNTAIFACAVAHDQALSHRVLAAEEEDSADNAHRAGSELTISDSSYRPNYMLASCMYGTATLKDILPEVRKVGATHLDIWPRVHGNQREQLDEIGEKTFLDLLQARDVKLGCITQYKLGPFGLADELPLAQRLGATTIVCGGVGQAGLKGTELKSAVRKFAEQMKPHAELAAECGVTIAIENHANNLIESPDSIKYFCEFKNSANLAIALAPYHLPQDESLLCDLIRATRGEMAVFYAWQHGMGCMTKLPKHQELLQMPGRGNLDFAPIMQTLAETNYRGWIEIFMHPVPRGLPIMPSIAGVTAEINRARSYLAQCLLPKSPTN